MMSTFFKNIQLPGVVILGISLMLATRTTAAEIETGRVPDQTLAFSVQSASVHEAIAQSTLTQETGIFGQSDVNSPNSTSQSSPSPAEGYGCVSGYDDGTFQGDQPISRYEFAAGLNACLNRVEQLINGSTADLATQEDLAVSKRQLENMRIELERLQMRVDGVDSENRQ
ncbi:MAG: S-layer homology domain-containing protein [Microcoleus sp. SIO2G3]|nr:S-layer homology domain-containing protein [Microcoleus sp. SIO2G3]